MSEEEPRRAFELLQKISIQNDFIKSQNQQIIEEINQLLSETREIKKINDDQLTELKRGRSP